MARELPKLVNKDQLKPFLPTTNTANVSSCFLYREDDLVKELKHGSYVYNEVYNLTGIFNARYQSALASALRKQKFPKVKSPRPGNYKIPCVESTNTLGSAKQADVKMHDDSEAASFDEKATKDAFYSKLSKIGKQNADPTAFIKKVLASKVEGLSVLDVMQNSSGDVQRLLFGSVPVQQLERLAGNRNMAASDFITEAGRLVSEYAKPIDIGLQDDPAFYTDACPSVDVSVNGHQIMAGLDSHSAMNVMRKDVATKARIVYTPEPNMGMITANGGAAPFLGCVRDCPVRVGNSVFPLPIFILESLSSEMLLGMPFWFAARLRTRCNGDGRMTCMLDSPNGGNSQEFTAHLTNGTTKRKGKTSTIFKDPKA